MRRIILGLTTVFMLFSACASASVSVRTDDGALLLRVDGGVIVPMGAYEDIVSLGSGMFAALQEGGYALMDESGVQRSETAYSDLRPAGKYLLACRDGSWGVMSLDGREISAFDYGRIEASGKDVFWALRGNVNDGESDELCILDAEGSERSTGIFVRGMGSASDGLVPVLLPENSLWGYCDAAGKLSIPARFSYAGEFISGYAVVAGEDGFGVIDAAGNVVVDLQYDTLELSPAGFILASRNPEGVCVLDMNGDIRFEFAGEDVFAALAGDGFMIFDGEGVRLFDADGGEIARLSPEAAVSEGAAGGLIISDGAWGEECVFILGSEKRYQNIYPLGLADGAGIYACMQANAARYVNDLLGEIELSVDMESARYGVLNADGELLLPCAYESIEYLADDRLLLYADGQWQMADTLGRVYWSHGIRQTEEPSF